MNVFDYIQNGLNKKKLHMTLIDPEKETIESVTEKVKASDELGTYAYMVGGSTDFSQSHLDEIIQTIKKYTNKPVILFPGNANGISRYADAIYFMMLLNSTSIEFLVRQQMRGAPIIKKLNLEPIPLGYIVIEPGMKVGEVGKAELIKSNEVEKAIAYAITAEYYGMKMVYLEAGSGAYAHVPEEIITGVKKNIKIPVIVGGGITNPVIAEKILRAGADVIVTGTLLEKSKNYGMLSDIIKLTENLKNET